MAMELENISVEQLKRAIQIREQLDGLQNELNELLGAPATGPRAARGRPAGKRTMSPAARARIAEAAKARWAKAKAAGKTRL